MLPKENRLKKKKDFEEIFKNRESFREGLLVLKIRKNKLKTNRFGFIVSQKVSKKAVVRNKIKRRLRDIIGREIKISEKGIDAAVIALPGSEKKSFFELKETAKKLFLKANV